MSGGRAGTDRFGAALRRRRWAVTGGALVLVAVAAACSNSKHTNPATPTPTFSFNPPIIVAPTTATATPSPSPTPTPSPTAGRSPTPTPAVTRTATRTPTPSPSASPTPAATPSVQVSEASGSTKSIKVGTVMTLSLPQDAGSSWAFGTSPNAAVLAVTGDQTLPPRAGAPAGSNLRRFTFKALSAGSTAFTLNEAPANIPNAPPVNTYTLNVTVTP